MDYYVIIPVFNEEKFLATTIKSLTSQTLKAKKIIIVNDNSTDSTQNIINILVRENETIDSITTKSEQQHMPGSKVVNAFKAGLELLDTSFDFIVKLDADLILPLHYFETIASHFKGDKAIGIAGGFVYEKSKHKYWVLNHPMNKDHVRGAFKAYTKECYYEIGELKSAMGWDTVDELLAKYYGYLIITDDTLHVKHLRPTGHIYSKKAKILQGTAMYTMRYGLLLTLIASTKMAILGKNSSTLYYNILGYFDAIISDKSPIVTVEEGVFIRNYRWTSIRKKLFT